jgi:hypothetical protein
MKMLFVMVFAVMILVFVPTLFAENLWYDNFNDNNLKAAYVTPDGGNGAGPPEWFEEDGVVKQTQPKPGDPTYLAVELDTDINFCGQLVQIRFDEWEDHDRSRAGIGFWLDPAGSYQGYTTVIHNSLTTGNYQFLNDARAWHGTQVDFDAGGVGSWFWMRAEIDFDAKTLNGKVWQGSLADEPADWMNETDYTTYGGVRQPTRWVGLNGGAGTTGGLSTVSFDEWIVYDSGGEVTTAVSPKSKLAVTWGTLKK